MVFDLRYRDKHWLYEQYIVNGHSANEIADMCGCGQPTVLRWLYKFGIPTRGPNDRNVAQYPELKDPEWIQERINSGMMPTDIAKELGCSYETVRRRMNEHGIPRPGNEDN